MFMEIDLGTPVQQSYVRNLKIKNTVLKYWPTKVVNGIEVFNRMYIWRGGVPNDTAHKEIYKLLNTSAEKLQRNNWSHVVSAWFYFKYYSLTVPILHKNNIINYINNNSILNKEYEVKMQYTQEFSGEVVGSANSISDKQIIDLIEGGYDSLYDPAIIAPTDTNLNKRVKPTPVYANSMITYDETVNPCTFASIMDTNNVLFTSATKIISKTIKEVNNICTYNNNVYNTNNKIKRYTVNAIISYTYKRVIDANDISVDSLMTLIKNIALTLPVGPYSFYHQIEALLRTYNPITSTELATSYSTTPIFDSYGNLRKDAVIELKPADFSKMLTKSIAVGHENEKCHGWKCIIGTILMVIITIAAVVLSVFTAGSSLAVGVAADAAVAAAFFGYLALYLTVGTLLMGLIAKYLSSNGEYGMAVSFGRSIVILNKLSQIVGYIAMVTGIYALWEKLSTTASTEASRQFLKDQGMKNVDKMTTVQLQDALRSTSASLGTNGLVTPTVSNYVSAGFEMVKGSAGSVFSNFSKSPGAALNKVMGWLNRGMQIYTKYINPVKQPPAGRPQGDTTPPTNIQDIAFKQAEFDSYSFLDMNAIMDQIPADLTTRGLMNETLSKYYNA